MRCEKCGTTNADDARACANCGYGLGDDPRGWRVSPWAKAALVAAVAGMVTFGLASVLGLLLGAAALIHVRRGRGRYGGQLVAVVSMAVSAAIIALLTPILLRARAKALQESCFSNIDQLALACIMYREDNDGHYPFAHNWCDATLTHNKTEDVYVCPARPRQRCGYAYNQALSGVHKDDVRSPAATVLLFDARGGWNNFGGPDLVDYRHIGYDGERCANMAFADGGRKCVSRDSLEVMWDPHWHPPAVGEP
jgi:hypothetical protein